jgi:transcriptional regulator with XRE-family HTH domain
MTTSKNTDQLVIDSEWDYDAFSSRINIAMNELSQYAFAKKCGFGESVLRGYLNGSSVPGTKKLIAMAKAAEVTIDWLATGEGEMSPDRIREQMNGYDVNLKENGGINDEQAEEQRITDVRNQFRKKMHDYKDATIEIDYTPPILITQAIKTVMYSQGLTKPGAMILLSAMKETENLEKK